MDLSSEVPTRVATAAGGNRIGRLTNAWHRLFRYGVVIKGFNGAWETLTGALFFLIGPARWAHWIERLTSHELIENPKDNVIQFLLRNLENVPAGARVFAAVYVLCHGLLNIFLAIQLYRDRLWAYQVAIATLVLFMIYQTYRIHLYHSVLLTVITLFDVGFLILTCHEYARLAGARREMVVAANRDAVG